METDGATTRGRAGVKVGMAKLKAHMTVIVATVVTVVVVAVGGFLGTAIAISSMPTATEAHDEAAPVKPGVDAAAAHSATVALSARAPEKPRTERTPWEASTEDLVNPAKVEDIPKFLKGTMIVELGLAEGLLGGVPELSATKDTVNADFSLRGDPKNRQREYGLMLAQAIVSHVYATGLPVKLVTFNIKDSNGKLALIGQVGANTIQNRPPGSWEQSADGTMQFIDWLRGVTPKDAAAGKAKAEDIAMIDGPWIR
jgi:hypothetical protein